MGTRKISQLETISDANLSGEAILPVVVSDPLIPNRKAKINQLFKGLAQGTKNNPGLCFDLDRDTGLYQTAYDRLGIAFGDGGFELYRIDNGNSNTSLYITAIDDTANNANIVLSPKGTGAVQVTGNFLVSDQAFILEDAQGPKARFEVSNVGTGTSTRVFSFPEITAGNGTSIVGDDTTQTLRNKTILIDEDNFIITDNTSEAIFQLAYSDSSGSRRSFFLPDAGAVTSTAEVTATHSTLLDTKATQTVLNKKFVNVKLAPNDSTEFFVNVDTSAITATRSLTMPDTNITIVGTDATQVLENKTIEDLILQDPGDNSKKINFSVGNQNTLSNEAFQFPATDNLNNFGAINTIVTTLAEVTLENKTLVSPTISQTGNLDGQVTLTAEGITGPRTIRFPDADATLLSTENVTLDDVNFGAGIGASNLTGLTRLQQFFYAGF